MRERVEILQAQRNENKLIKRRINTDSTLHLRACRHNRSIIHGGVDNFFVQIRDIALCLCNKIIYNIILRNKQPA